ncbi:MAG: hypothetical protein K5785_00835 [Nitrosarchaeum sp.]|nr:hypothetical protein [Nitrosarchaeum sp.]
MSEETLRCPGCQTGMLSTPLIRWRSDDGRKAKNLPIKYCRFCDIYITSGMIKIWNGNEIVEVRN